MQIPKEDMITLLMAAARVEGKALVDMELLKVGCRW